MLVRDTVRVAGTVGPTHADYLLFDLLDLSAALAPDSAPPALAKCCPKLAQWQIVMRARPKLAAYLASPLRRPA